MTQLALLAMTRQACLNAHFVSRTLRTMGFEPRIIPALYVKPFRKGKKNDYNDAEAIAEAALRPKPIASRWWPDWALLQNSACRGIHAAGLVE